MKVSEAFGGFLEAEDLPEGKDITVTIEAVREPSKDDKGQDGKLIDKPIVKFAKVKKELIMNKTNAKAIRRMFGENEMTNWVGKQITIYRTTCNAFGDKNRPCIRVKGERL
jgi:hypothetical protein